MDILSSTVTDILTIVVQILTVETDFGSGKPFDESLPIKVKTEDGNNIEFSYTKVDDKWTINLELDDNSYIISGHGLSSLMVTRKADFFTKATGEKPNLKDTLDILLSLRKIASQY